MLHRPGVHHQWRPRGSGPGFGHENVPGGWHTPGADLPAVASLMAPSAACCCSWRAWACWWVPLLLCQHNRCTLQSGDKPCPLSIAGSFGRRGKLRLPLLSAKVQSDNKAYFIDHTIWLSDVSAIYHEGNSIQQCKQGEQGTQCPAS